MTTMNTAVVILVVLAVVYFTQKNKINAWIAKRKNPPKNPPKL